MMRVQHDSGYKLLFSHPEMVRDLLTGFVREDWVARLDLSSLRKESSSYVADSLRDREDDVVWRVRWGDGWLYVYLLLEFQSTVDRHMAVRIMGYVGLLYQDLIRTGAVGRGEPLPPVVPVVLYNGQSRWDAATDMADLVAPIPGSLRWYCPQVRYLLVDEGATDESEPLSVRNLVAALFRLEKSRRPEDVRQMVAALRLWLESPAQAGLRRAFTVWIKRVLLPGRLPGVEVPEVTDLQEVESMLAERVLEWTEQWKREGLEEGRKEGRKEGRRDMLEKQLQRRFGVLPEWALQRLNAAGSEELDGWAERVLEARTLQEVLA